MRSPATEVRTVATGRGIERGTDLLNGVANDVPSPVLWRDDGNVVVGRPDETLAGLGEFCEHGCGGGGTGKHDEHGGVDPPPYKCPVHMS